MAPDLTCPVELYQQPHEFAQLLDLYRALQPRRVLEIGSLFGGTLWHWMVETAPGATLASVDLFVSISDPRHAQQRLGHRELWPAWAEQFGHALTVVELPSNFHKVTDRLPFNEVDFLFIDADHRYEAVKADYLRFAPMVRSGGLIALHDIGANNGPGFGTKRFWRELKAEGLQTSEFIEKMGEWGIGVVHVS